MMNNNNIHKIGGILTTLTNPGIIDRLEQDIQDYLHEFGFRIERECNDNDDVVDGTPARRKDKAVIFIPTLPYSYSNSRDDECTASRHNTNSDQQSISSEPIGTLHLHIQNEIHQPLLARIPQHARPSL